MFAWMSIVCVESAPVSNASSTMFPLPAAVTTSETTIPPSSVRTSTVPLAVLATAPVTVGVPARPVATSPIVRSPPATVSRTKTFPAAAFPAEAASVVTFVSIAASPNAVPISRPAIIARLVAEIVIVDVA